MIGLRTAGVVVAMLLAASAGAEQRRWENPRYADERTAVEAAKRLSRGGDLGGAERLFVDCTLTDGERGRERDWGGSRREMVGDFLMTRAVGSDHDETQSRTIDRFRAAIPDQARTVAERAGRFGLPELDGLVWLKMVDSVDAFSGLNASSDRMSRVGGVTYYCRYVVLPLSYIGSESIRELKRSAAMNPSLDVSDTLRRWQRESYASLVNTFRHELVHVYINSGLDVPRYSERGAYPTWFHEGSATYLAGDPHSGLSTRYQQYQNLFFYLVQRHGPARLSGLYNAIFGGQDVRSALVATYNLQGSDELFAAAGRWHRVKNRVGVGFWILGFVIVGAAFRGVNLPVIGALSMLVAAALLTTIPFGLAEHLQGLNGPAAVLAAKAVIVAAAAAAALFGALRIRRHLRA